MNRFWFLLLLLLSLDVSGQIQVTLRINNQPYEPVKNFSTDLTSLIDSLVRYDRIILWNSSDRNNELNESYKSIVRKDNEFNLKNTSELYIHEVWNLTKKSNKIEISGISFSSKGHEREKILGYVDYENLLPYLRTNINVDANGSYVTLYEDVLRNKWYDFTIFQYGEITISSLAESEKIINSDLKKRKLTNARKIPPAKKIRYEIELSGNNSLLLLATIEDLFLKNTELLLNYGGDKISKLKDSVKVNKLEFEELWVKNGEGMIQYLPINMRIHVNGSELDLIPFITYNTWNIIINGKSLEEFRRDKNFNFVINKINSQNILKSDAELYQKALYNYDWDKLSVYVKNFK